MRNQGLIIGLPGSGWYVRPRRPVMRLARNRLSRAERAAGRGTFTSDAHTGSWAARVEVDMRVEPAGDEVAATLEIEQGAEVLVRDRVMFADDEPVQLATSYLPRDITRGTVIENEDTGPGGVYARLEESGHQLVHFQEAVRIGLAAEHEAALLDIAPGAPVYRIRRVAHTAARPVEANFITAIGERYELLYELPAE
ncbi:GntR family transcriptional regulator [Pseudonocardia sp. CA-142604]|uniref:GntR family transcriptional regulator n=1 Tax=Pseudonocardia sp. CA-142604 TaxID=3240024 RepID=UPI003D89C8EC